MARKPRLISSTGIYHVILRSVNQHIIFEEDSDYQKFLFILSDCKNKHGIDVLAYCLMSNHIHLLLHSDQNNLSSFFQSLGSRFVKWYNNKYSRSGHLFQDRYRSFAIENETYYLSVLCYIHYNPVKANACRYPSEYRFSSYNTFYGQKNSLVNISYSYDIAGSKEYLLNYFSCYDYENTSLLHHDGNPATVHFLTDEKAVSVFKELTNLASLHEIEALPKQTRNDYIKLLKDHNFTQKQIARLMDVSVTTIKRVCSK